VEFVHAISYVNKIKTRFANDERVYKAFLEILNMYRKNLKSISQVYEEVATLFKTHNDLLEEFTYFLPDFSTPGAGKKGAKGRGKGALPPGGANKRKGKNDKAEPPLPPAEQERKTAESLSKELSFFEKVKSRLKNRDAYNELIKCINIFNSEVISKMELQALVYDIIGKYPDLHGGFSDFLAQCELMDFDFGDGKAKDGKLTQREAQKQKMMSAREKFLSKPISELDLSACERCGPSYRLLPKNFPKATASARTPLCIEHLNDNWVSVTSGSEDYSFKAMRKNQYEEALFRCEDDRFELDMVLETTRVTIEVIEPIVEKASKMTPEEASTYRLPEGHLTPIHLRSIERLYGIGTDQGTDIRRMIQDYPAATAPIVLGRLKQKEAEWKKVKTEVTPIWVDVYEKNYNKSLDHRSFYFKQTDKKALSAKGMTSEIKEVSDKKKTSEEAIGCGSVGAMGPHGISPDLTFTYVDRKVHDDVFAVLKFSTQEMMNAEQAERVMKTWREFIEPFFGISRADPEGDYVDDSAEQAAVFVRKDEEEEEENDEGENDGEGSDKPASGDDAADTEMEDADEKKARKDKDSEEDEDDEAPGKKRKATAAGKGAKGKKAKKEESEEEEEEESDEDDEEEKLYAACKPLSGVAVSSDEETVAATPLEKLDGRVFYGHDGYYMLFRLHQHLYERLSTARASAASMSQQFGQKAEPEAVRAAKEREIHNDFLRLLFKLLNGTVESSNFEDDCRTLLGANSYVLFTLDKLIYKIVKQIQSLLADENATKLLHLLDYEKSRKSPFVEAIYHANASVLLLDESCYRFGSVDDGASLTLQLMESGLDKADLPAGTMEAQFHDYLESFLQTSADEEDEEDGGKPWMADSDERPDVYLRRSKTAAGLDQGPDAMGQTSVYNSLECKISCSNSKVSYVLDTEDVFHRRVGTGAGKGLGRGAAGVAAAAAKAERASAKFNAWLEEKQATMPKEDEAAKATEAEAVPDFATAAAAAALADVETHEEELAEEDADDAEDGDAAAEEEDDADDDDEAVEADAPADEEMEDAEGDEQDQ
jgi:paired amphipathic helix protein Sin3a